jgi:hypothetical protein
LSGGEEGGRIRGHNVIPVEIDKQSLGSDIASGKVRYVTRGVEETAAFSRRAKDIWTRLLDDVRNISKVDDRDIKSRPLINPEAITDAFCSNRQP